MWFYAKAKVDLLAMSTLRQPTWEKAWIWIAVRFSLTTSYRWFSSKKRRNQFTSHLESWAPKIDAFEPWCWRRLLRVPWTARRSNQSILKEINPEYSLEGLMLKLQYFGHLMRRANSLEKIPMLGKTEGRRRRGWWRRRWLDGITDSIDMSLSKP